MKTVQQKLDHNYKENKNQLEFRNGRVVKREGGVPDTFCWSNQQMTLLPPATKWLQHHQTPRHYLHQLILLQSNLLGTVMEAFKLYE